MEVYLVRHGEATSEARNPERPLTARGREDACRVSAATAGMRLRPTEIRHSGKLRAKETAEIFAEVLGLQDRVVAVSGMAPNDDVRPVAEVLQSLTAPLMLVGHLPFLSRLSSLLLVGDPERALIMFSMSGIVSLSRQGETKLASQAPSWMVAWMLTPDIVAPQTTEK